MEHSVNTKLLGIKLTDQLFNLLFETKLEHLETVREFYGVQMEEVKEILKEELFSSNLDLLGCNTAVDFLIVSIKEEKLKPQLRELVKQNIFASAVYYVNGLGIDVTLKP